MNKTWKYKEIPFFLNKTLDFTVITYHKDLQISSFYKFLASLEAVRLA